MPSNPIRILHVITGLTVGGAERSLATVALKLPRSRIESSVASIIPDGPIAATLRAGGIRVFELGTKNSALHATIPFKLRSLVRKLSPHIVQGWMYHGNALAALATPKGIPLAFNIRQSLPDLGAEKYLTRLIIRLGTAVSGRAGAIIYNSQRARSDHESLGYVARNATVIPNGFDTSKFSPSEALRRACRAELGLSDNDFVAGTVGRYHPVKNQRLFLEAAASLLGRGERLRFVIVGRDVSAASSGLVAYAKTLGIAERILFVEEYHSVPGLMNALDVFCLTSNAEGFPNVVGEAMACGVPIVATDVGDVARLVGNAGRLVDVGDSEALARELAAAARRTLEDRRAVAQFARARIETEFAEGRMLNAYASLYDRLLA
jgi:glycosyltransferase involved in cell wall biosynthesis